MKLVYEKIIINHKGVLIYSVLQILISLGLIVLLSWLFDTPKEYRLKKELDAMKYELYMLDHKADGVYYFLQTIQQKDSIILDAFDNHEEELDITTPETVGDKLDNIGKILQYSSERLKNVFQTLSANDDRLKHYPAIQPISKKDLKRISSGFSVRIHPVYRMNRFHYGIDFAAPQGTPIYATADGTVVAAGSFLSYGNYIKISHGYEYETAYGHLHSVGVRKGQKVFRGQIIGVVGNTGISTGDHLHYEVIYRDKPVNPINYFAEDITAEEYQMMIKIQETLRVGLD